MKNNPPYFSTVTLLIDGKFKQDHVFISREEFESEKQKEIEGREKFSVNKGYKSKYNMYNCLVEDCPLLREASELVIGSIFNYTIPYNGGKHFAEIANAKTRFAKIANLSPEK